MIFFMRMKNIFYLLIIAVFPIISCYAEHPCSLKKGKYVSVEVEDILCLAQNSGKDISIFYTFADWCLPCKESVPEIVRLSQRNDIALFFIIIDRESDLYNIDRAINFLNRNVEQPRIYIISDSLYSPQNRVKKQSVIQISGKKEREKYINFLTNITPPEFKVTTDIGKSILINEKGNILLITSYEDKGKDDKGQSLVYQKIEECIKKERVK